MTVNTSTAGTFVRFHPVKMRLPMIAVLAALIAFLLLAPAHLESDETLANTAYRQMLAGNTKAAVALYRRALERNPASPYRWCDFGEASLQAGNTDMAKRCMTRAAALGPHMPQILLRAANLAFALGDTDSALSYGSRVLAIVPDYDEIVFSTYERMGIPLGDITARGLPDGRAAESFAKYRVAQTSR